MTKIKTLLKKVRPALAAYVLLTAFVIFAFAQERQHSNDNRIAVANSTKTVLIQSCQRGNDLRAELRSVLKLATTPGPHQHPTAAQLKAAEDFYKKAAARVPDINCQKFYGRIK